MKIVEARVLVTSPGRNYVLLKVMTDEGLWGWGDATLNGRELAVAAYLRDHVSPLLIGRDAARIEDTWQYLYRGSYWRRGAVAMTAISAVDVALWDLKAKAAQLPLYQLLGGASREGATVYAHADGTDLPQLLDKVQSLVEMGYTAVRLQAGVPGLEHVYGVPSGGPGFFYEPANGTRPAEHVWDTSAYLEFVPRMVEAVRDRFGNGLELLHDVHHRLSPMEAARLGRSLEPYRMWWVEDPTPAEDQTSFRLVRQHTVAPLAAGEVFSSIWDCQGLITERLIDYVRVSVTHAGGITHLRRISDLAHLFGVRTGPHGAGDLSPVSMAATLHLDLAVPNFGIQEYMGHAPPWEDVFQVSYQRQGAHMHPGETPGLGVEVDEDAAGHFVYEPRYLPVNRLRDGSMHDW